MMSTAKQKLMVYPYSSLEVRASCVTFCPRFSYTDTPFDFVFFKEPSHCTVTEERLTFSSFMMSTAKQKLMVYPYSSLEVRARCVTFHPLHWRTGLYLYIPRLPTHFLENMHVSVKKRRWLSHIICVCLYIGVRGYICISLGYQHIFSRTCISP